jgi:multidrug efflux pump subunit AcrA (membrane-fusion protein)
MKIAIALAPLALFAACTRPELPEAQAGPIQVRATVVRRGTMTASISVSGETAALKALRLASPVAGRVTAVAAWPGDRVKPGQIVARVLPLENEAGLQGFTLLQDAGALSADESIHGKQLAAELRRADVALRVPYSAVIADRLRNPGERVGANDVLLEMFDPESLYVLAQVPLQSVPSIGMPVEIAFPGGAMAQGHVAALLAALTPRALTVPVRVAIDVPLSRPLLYSSVQCRIITAQRQDTLFVPRSALLQTGAEGRGTVMIAVGDHARRRTIGIGLRSADRVEVTDGLVDGDVVLVDGQYALPDDTAVALQMLPAA